MGATAGSSSSVASVGGLALLDEPALAPRRSPFNPALDNMRWPGFLLIALMAAMAFLHLAGCSSKPGASASGGSTSRDVAGQKQGPALAEPGAPASASTRDAIKAVAATRGELVRPPRALVFQLQREPWQALTAACLTPAFYNSQYAVPLVLDDGTGKREVAIAHDTATVAGFGGDAAAATAKFARTYWKKAPCAFVVESYQQALWIVPSAAIISAPILVEPEESTLAALGVKTAVVVGDGTPPVKETIRLAGKEDAWKFQLALLAAQGKKCDYVVMTNPHDADAKLNPNVQWPYLSLAAAPLAAYHQAIVQTADYTGDRKNLHALGGALGDTGDKTKYESVKATFQKVKDDSLAAEKFLADNGQTPRFLGMVGGSIELPYYICDIHTRNKYWDTQIDYVPADTPYATMRSDVDYARFVKPDLGVGRVIADNVLDATVMLARSFFRKEFLPGGKYAALAPAGWETKAVLYDGHRLNQPDEGGPDASPKEPFYPANEVMAAFSQGGLKADYVLPRDETKQDDLRATAGELLEKTGGYGAVQFVTHGDPPFMRIEVGKQGKDVKNYMATGPEFRKHLNFPAPTAIYVIGCHVGTVYAPFRSNDDFLPMSAVHAGAVAFMAPHNCQAICFWRYAPKGPGASQCFYFWENVLTKKMPVGLALIDAKWRAYEEWKDKQSEASRDKDSDNAAEVDAPSLLLFGDPALRLAE